LALREEDFALHRGSEIDLAPILLVTADESSRGCVERLQHEYALWPVASHTRAPEGIGIVIASPP
jgi:hypothetical protein